MTQTGWRLERTLLAGAGFPESRLEGLDIDWSDPLEPTGHAALWADNGTGKTTITALRYALYLPHARDFIRGDSDRSLAKLVRSGDICHVVEQATRIVDGEQQRIVVGMVADWSDGGTRDLANPSKLDRDFYGWLTGPDGPTIDDLPLRTGIGRWATHAQFIKTLRDVMPHGGAAPPYGPSGHQGRWQDWLSAAGVDLEQIRFQSVMNASEGGVDRVMRFTDSDAFVRWLIGATMPAPTVEQVTKSIDTLRRNAANRPRWADELDLWERIIEPLLELAITHEKVTEARQAAATAEASATAIVADADATAAALTAERKTATEQFGQHDKRRRDAGSQLRRAQAHRLRMQLRTAELRVQTAEKIAEGRRERRDDAVHDLKAWRLVDDVLIAREARGKLAGLQERLDAAEKETSELRRDEDRHRRALSRVLTHRRDSASSALKAAEDLLAATNAQLKTVADALESCLTERAATNEQVKHQQGTVNRSEQILAEAIAAGMLIEETDPAAADALQEQKIASARRAREDADRALRRVDTDTIAARSALASAERRLTIARDDIRNNERRLAQITQRVTALTEDDRLLEITGRTELNPWGEREFLTDALHRWAERADTDAARQREAIASARRIVNSVGADGLFPAPAITEEIAGRCQANDLPAWPGWRWLADTMTPQDAQAFAVSRPDIASGVVVAHPDLLDAAIEAIGDIDLDVALWVGAITDPRAAARGEPNGSTRAHVFLPPPGIYDREAAQEKVASAENDLTEATHRLDDATTRANNARELLATLAQLWKDHPEDPRNEFAKKIDTARERHNEAGADQRTAHTMLEELTEKRDHLQDERQSAQQAVDDGTETRRLLAPVITAATALAEAKELLPGLRRNIRDLDLRLEELRRDQSRLIDDAKAADERVRTHTHARDDAAEALREAGLTPNGSGPVPDDDEVTIRAQLESIEAALADAAVDPELHLEIEHIRRSLSDIEATLGTAAASRSRAEEFADRDGARHAVALASSIRRAEENEAKAREEHAKAEAVADAARKDFRRRSEDLADKSSPDVEGVPPAAQVTDPDDAERIAHRLDELATELLERQRAEEHHARTAEQAVQRTTEAIKLINASAQPLQYLRDATLNGQHAEDVDQIIEKINELSERVRVTHQRLSDSEREQHNAANTVRAHANGRQARWVEERDDPRVTDLILRLRAGERLDAEAEHIAANLEQRVASLRDDLDNHERHVRTCATMLHVQAATALQRLRAYQNQSRLPQGLGDWSDHKFVVIDHEPVPTDESVAVDRVARVVHSLLVPGAGKSDAQSMLFAAARALVDAPFRVRLLKPHTDLALDRVDVAELKNFSGGQRVTAGVLLYATMTQVRAAGDTTSIGWLWLDNPFGQASADQFVRTMRLAADKLGLQLLFTAAPKDKGALSMFDRVVTLARRSRPSSGEKIVVVEDGSQRIVDLTLIQKDVNAVLGE